MQVAYAKNTRRPGRWREEAEKQSYGALNAIGGMNRSGRYIYSPWDHCLRPPIDPVYRGPCPPNPASTTRSFMLIEHLLRLPAQPQGSQ